MGFYLNKIRHLRVFIVFEINNSLMTSIKKILEDYIFELAHKGEVDLLQKALEDKTNIESARLINNKVEGTTPLIIACRLGNLMMVKYLIETRAADLKLCGSVNFDGEVIEDAPPLWCASAAGHLEVVKCLVENGADTNCRTKTNSTPMRAACFDGHQEIVIYLIEHAADIEISNRHGHTCLMIACYKGHANIVEILLKAGAAVNRTSSKENTAFHDCTEQGSVETAKLLQRYGATMTKDNNGITPLMTAAMAGHPDLVEFLCSAYDHVTLQEKIHAYEMLGCTSVDRKHNIS